MNDEYVEYKEVIEDPRNSIITSTDAEIKEESYKNNEDRKRAEMQEMFENKDFQRTFMRLHTPLNATKLPGRNDICPYCDSGKKFKNCECYKTHKVEYRNKYFNE